MSRQEQIMTAIIMGITTGLIVGPLFTLMLIG